MKIVTIPGGISQMKIDSQLINFPFKLWDYFILENSLVGLMDWDEIKTLRQDLDERRCIWCFNLDGSVKWMIEPPYRTDKEGKKHLMDDVFLAMKFVNGKLRALTSYGSGYDLDIETGKISNWKHSK